VRATREVASALDAQVERAWVDRDVRVRAQHVERTHRKRDAIEALRVAAFEAPLRVDVGELHALGAHPSSLPLIVFGRERKPVTRPAQAAGQAEGLMILGHERLGSPRAMSDADALSSERNAVLAGFLGWTLDAFDFFVLTFVLDRVAHDFHKTIPEIALTLTASLAMRPVGALIFGLLADRYGRRWPLILDVIFYSIIEVLSGLAPSYAVFLLLRLLYGIGMGGEWGVGASLAMESVPARRRGILSGLLQEGYALGFLLAALAYYAIFPSFGWRALFFVGGLPALLTLFIRGKVQESRAWKESKTDWRGYGRAITKNWKLFFYLVLLMAMMNFISHGTQDLYPTFLKKQRHMSPHETAVVTMISMLGAIAGGLVFGYASDVWGRRRAMVVAVLAALVLVPLWIAAGSVGWIVAGAFAMQFMVQGAWGVVPAHINELSPGPLRGFFPGFAYQLGVLIASSIAYVEAVLAAHMSYAASMGILAAAVLLVGALVIGLGPEARGIAFHAGDASVATEPAARG
jgi:MFS transporter, SHS family, lactate transporter